MRCPACGSTDLADHQYIQGHHVFICKNPMCGQWLERVTVMRVIGRGGYATDFEREGRYTTVFGQALEDNRLLAILAEEG